GTLSCSRRKSGASPAACYPAPAPFGGGWAVGTARAVVMCGCSPGRPRPACRPPSYCVPFVPVCGRKDTQRFLGGTCGASEAGAARGPRNSGVQDASHSEIYDAKVEPALCAALGFGLEFVGCGMPGPVSRVPGWAATATCGPAGDTSQVARKEMPCH